MLSATYSSVMVPCSAVGNRPDAIHEANRDGEPVAPAHQGRYIAEALAHVSGAGRGGRGIAAQVERAYLDAYARTHEQPERGGSAG